MLQRQMITDLGEPSSKHAQSKTQVLRTEPRGRLWVSLALQYHYSYSGGCYFVPAAIRWWYWTLKCWGKNKPKHLNVTPSSFSSLPFGVNRFCWGSMPYNWIDWILSAVLLLSYLFSLSKMSSTSSSVFLILLPHFLELCQSSVIT